VTATVVVMKPKTLPVLAILLMYISKETFLNRDLLRITGFLDFVRRPVF
jgi:hypothetical protein